MEPSSSIQLHSLSSASNTYSSASARFSGRTELPQPVVAAQPAYNTAPVQTQFGLGMAGLRNTTYAIGLTLLTLPMMWGCGGKDKDDKSAHNPVYEALAKQCNMTYKEYADFREVADFSEHVADSLDLVISAKEKDLANERANAKKVRDGIKEVEAKLDAACQKRQNEKFEKQMSEISENADSKENKD